KELLALVRDPRGRFILIVPPLVQLLVFTFAATQEVKNVPVAVRNKDYGTHARDLVARIEGSPNFSRVIHLHSDDEIAPAIDSRAVLMVVHIGADFSREVAAGRPAEVQLLLDGRRANAAQLAAGYAGEIVAGYDGELAAGQGRPTALSTVVARGWFAPNLDPQRCTV